MVSTLAGIAATFIAAFAAIVLAVAGWFAWQTRRIAADAERRVPPSGSFVTVDGERIHYVERGAGPPILMIHGLGATLHHMRRPLMETLGDDYRLIAFDRPGSGYSTRSRRSDGRLTEQARVVAGLIDALGLEKPLLVGHSLGGAVALAVALDYPEKVSGLALISPLTRTEPELRPEFRAMAIRSPLKRRILAYTLALPASVKRSDKTLAFVFGPQQPPPDFAVEGGGLSVLRPSHFYASVSDLVALEHDLAAQQTRYGELSVPVGVFFGTADRVLDWRHHGLPMKDEIAALDFEIADGMGHMPQYAVTNRVAAFVRRIADKAFVQRAHRD